MPETIDAVGRRYANMDMTPYWEGLDQAADSADLSSPGLPQGAKL